eukprot:1297083-Pleurochrysis_carterae.AAC.1
MASAECGVREAPPQDRSASGAQDPADPANFQGLVSACRLGTDDPGHRVQSTRSIQGRRVGDADKLRVRPSNQDALNKSQWRSRQSRRWIAQLTVPVESARSFAAGWHGGRSHLLRWCVRGRWSRRRRAVS